MTLTLTHIHSHPKHLPLNPKGQHTPNLTEAKRSTLCTMEWIVNHPPMKRNLIAPIQMRNMYHLQIKVWSHAECFLGIFTSCQHRPQYITFIYLTVPTTHTSPHETHEANLMRTHRHIDVNHYALDNQGRAVCLTPFPNALEGTHANTKVPFIHVGQQD